MDHQGGCLCGAVRYVAKGPLREVVYCQRGQCRKQTGLYYAATAVAKADLTLTAAETLRGMRRPTLRCEGLRHLGSALFWKAPFSPAYRRFWPASD